MALQGDLNSFALPDVLRLLAGTGKSGRLEINGIGANGVLMLADGRLSSAAATSAPHAADAGDVVFELLRMDGGSFYFDEGDVSDRGMEADIDDTIARAESLVVEWADVETVVPSMDVWITFAPEIAGDEVMINADQWRALVAIGAGANVHDVAAGLELTDLAACRQVRELVEGGMVSLRETHGYLPPTVELDDFEQYELEAYDLEGDPSMTDIEDLVAEDRPVVMEDRDDALLPEPLPSEGVAYEGESITGVVDGRAVEATEPTAEDGTFTDFESLAEFESEAAMANLAGEPGTIDAFEAAGDLDDEDDDEADADDDDPEAEAGDGEPVAEADVEADADDERGSLLKFLSTVKH